MLDEVGHCKGIENYIAPPVGRGAGRAADHADRLPAQGCADVPRREPPDDRPARRPCTTATARARPPGRVRLSPALGAGQPAAEVRGVRAAHAPGGVRLGHPGGLREDSTPARWWSRWCAPPGWSTRWSRCARPPTQVDDVLQRNPHCAWTADERVLDHHADQAHGRAAHRVPEPKTACKVRYLHSDIDTVERVEIIRDLRLGAV